MMPLPLSSRLFPLVGSLWRMAEPLVVILSTTRDVEEKSPSTKFVGRLVEKCDGACFAVRSLPCSVESVHGFVGLPLSAWGNFHSRYESNHEHSKTKRWRVGPC